jgi:hypothetical protein
VYREYENRKIELRPIDARLGLSPRVCSQLLEEFTQMFCVENAFGQAAPIVGRRSLIHLPLFRLVPELSDKIGLVRPETCVVNHAVREVCTQERREEPSVTPPEPYRPGRGVADMPVKERLGDGRNEVSESKAEDQL